MTNKIESWSVKDAKCGDILVYGDDKRPFIFKGLLDKFHPECPVAYCEITVDNTFAVSSGVRWWTNEKVQPATKEECDLLFEKMHEAGYRWDVGKKELIYER